MFRKLKTHIKYKIDNIEIRPASLGEEYEIGSWPSTYKFNNLDETDKFLERHKLQSSLKRNRYLYYRNLICY